MTETPTFPGKTLVVIACYGTGNDRFLARVIQEYRAIPFDIDIVVCSNIPKDLGPDIEVIVGLPTRNPRSLPFAPRRVLADRIDRYDLFIYSEDDILITERNLRAFSRATCLLGGDEVAGFLRFEKGSDGSTHFPDVHHRYHWDAASIKRSQGHTFAYFTNEHAACYLLTRAQLAQVVASGGFLVEPHEGKYDMLETAATDPYTQCGLRKLICISHLNDFLVHHLPNKYVGKLGIEAGEVLLQTAALSEMAENGRTSTPLFDAAPTRMGLAFSKSFAKNYYEPVRTDVLSLIERRAGSVLSIGCGWGAAEDWLSSKAIKVVAVPVDQVIAACAKARGLRVVLGEFPAVRQQLEGEKFDYLLLSNVLHLVDEPVEFLSVFSELLTPNAKVVAVVPNLCRIPDLWRSIRDIGYPDDQEHFEMVGMHRTSELLVRKWLRSAGFTIEKVINVVPDRVRSASRATLGLLDSLLAEEFVAVAKAN